MRSNFYKLLVVAAAAAATLVSCGESAPQTFAVKSTEIGGEMGEYFKLVDMEYPDCGAESKYCDVLIKLQVEKIKEIPYDKSTLHAYNTYFDLNHESIEYRYNFGLDLFDKDGVLLAKFPATQEINNCIYSSDEIEDLRNIAVGENGFVKVKFDYYELSEEDVKRAVNLRLTSTLESVNGASMATSSASGGSADWDGILDELDEYVDQYIVVMRKANGGDMDALVEAASMMESAESIGEQLDDAEGSLSSSQLSRYAEISQKLSDAAMSFI